MPPSTASCRAKRTWQSPQRQTSQQQTSQRQTSKNEIYGLERLLVECKLSAFVLAATENRQADRGIHQFVQFIIGCGDRTYDGQ
jgi:hypothetical protein